MGTRWKGGTDFDLSDVVLSWSVEDILDSTIYEDEVKKIPDQFRSEEEYLQSFKLPLIEETRADLSSCLEGISEAPNLIIRRLEDRRTRTDLFQYMEVENWDDKIYQGKFGDILLLSSICPEAANDLLRYNVTYDLAMVKDIFIDKDSKCKWFKIRVSGKIDSDELNRCTYAVFLSNILTNIRICRALHFEKKVENNFALIRRVLLLSMERSISDVYKDYPEQDLVGPHEKLLSLNLNNSQLTAVKTAIFAFESKFRNSNSINLIWGPPGTGKTKTVSTILWALRQSNCRTLTCAPTNVAIAGVCARLIQLLKHFEKGKDCFSDVVLLGNKDRMDITDELLDVFLENRVLKLIDCFSPKTGCIYRISSMIGLLENPSSQYDSYLEENKTENRDPLTFLAFLRKQYNSFREDLKNGFTSLIVHFPRSQLSWTNYNNMISLMDLLSKFGFELSSQVLSTDELNYLFENETKPRCSVGTSVIETRVECLKLLRSLLDSLDLPNEIDEDWVRDFCLENASMIFCTASSSFMLHNSEARPFDVLIIDEAAQLKECESVIPLRLEGIRHAILVGDEMQLPSMVKSSVSKKAGFGLSLFERLVSLGHEKQLLNIQYRMHPSISRFPNSQFYGEKLIDGPNVNDSQYNNDYADLIFGSYAFVNVEDGREESDCLGNSKRNLVEVGVVLYLIQTLFESWKNRSNKARRLTIGVISPYAAQIGVIKDKVEMRYDGNNGFQVRVKSVDGFQGEEDDIIILSTVRCNASGSVGFVKNIQRTNVSITRAKHCLWIVGSASTLARSGTVWQDLVIDARNRNCLFGANNYKEIKKVILRVKTELNQLDDFLTSDSLLFGSTSWKVLFSDEFRKSFTRLRSTQIKRDTINLLLQIATGWRSKRKNVANVSDPFDLARIYKIGDLYLVWSTDLEKEERFVQIVRVWDLLPLMHVERLVRRMNHVFSLYTDGYMERCQAVRLERAIEVPKTWNVGTNIIKFRKDHQNESTDEVHARDNEPDPAALNSLENSKVSESLLLMKFYALSSGVAKHLLTARDGSELDVPFQLNDQEREIIRFPLSSFILGRSGTGKTTVLSTKLVQKEQQFFVASHGTHNDDIGTSKDAESRDVKNEKMEKSGENNFVKQVFITVSPKLCSAIKNHINRFRRFVCGNVSDEADFDMHDVIGKHDDFVGIPDTFVDLDERHFPLIITFWKFIMMVDGTMDYSFFDRFYTSWGTLCDSGVKKSHALQSLIQSKEVDFEKFAYSYWPHFNTQLTKKLDPSTVFTQIISHIKGGSNRNEGRLDREEYVMLSGKRFSSLDGETRGKIYDIFLDYEMKKRAEGEFDLSDCVNYLHTRLNQDGFKGDKVDYIYIDEVQDLTTRQISLLKHVCTNFNEGFVFAGDTAQTIAKGVDFRFEDIRSIFYTEFLMSTTNQENELHVTDIFQLHQNFRTHCGVLKLAQSVIDMLYHYFPFSVDKLTPETSLVYGEAPILLESSENENAIAKIFGEKGEKRKGKLNEFGAEQAILVRDEQAKKQVVELVGKQAIVLTILECKGLEFQDVLLYDFFGSSPLERKWRVVYGFMENHEIFDLSMTRSFPNFDLTLHNLLCSELKQLYVAITRTRQRLWICESSGEFSKPMYDYWKRLCLVQVQQLDSSVVQDMGNASSPEDWKQRGIKLFNEEHFEMATMCFEKAGDVYREKWARAAGLVAAADRVIGINSEMGRTMLFKAAETYASIDKHDIEASCYIKLGDFEKGGRVYLEKCGTLKLEDAGDCFVWAKKWLVAADTFFKAKCISKCLAACSKGELFEKGLCYMNKWKEDQSKYEDPESVCEKYTASCAELLHERGDTKRMMIFVEAFGSVDRIRMFLKQRDLVDELLAWEVKAGNFLEAIKISERKGDLLMEAEMCEKAGLLEKAAHLLLFYVKTKSLWSFGNKGWPPKPFDKKDELLRKAKCLGKGLSDSFAKTIHLEADLLGDKPKSLMELSKFLNEADGLKNIWVEFLATRAILDVHLSEHARFVFESELCQSSGPRFRELMMRNSELTPSTLLHAWNRLKNIFAQVLSCFNNPENKCTTDENIVYREFSVEYFGLKKYNVEDIYLMLNPDAWWIRDSGKMPLKREKNPSLMKSAQFVSCAKSYLMKELFTLGVKVLEKLETIVRSYRNESFIKVRHAISISMFEVARFLRQLESGRNDDTLKRFFRLSEGCFWDVMFPLDWRNGVDESIVRSLDNTSAVELLDELLDSTVGSSCVQLSYGQLGKIAMIIFSMGKFPDAQYSKIAGCLVDKPEWKEFFVMLKTNLDHGFERMVMVLSEWKEFFVIFEKALKSTFEANWIVELDYISPHCFLYLLERLVFLISSCRGYIVTTKSSLAEMVKLRCFESYFDSSLQVIPGMEGFGGISSLLQFSRDSILEFLRNKKEMRQWIKRSGLPSYYYQLMVLKLVIMFYVVNMNAGFDMYTAGKNLLDFGVFDDLPLEFSKRLRQTMFIRIDTRDISRVLNIFADVFVVIGDPLVFIGSYPIATNSNLYYISSYTMCNRDAIMMVLFPEKKSTRVGEGEGLALTSPVVKTTGKKDDGQGQSLTSPVVEEAGEKDVGEGLALTSPVVEETGEKDVGEGLALTSPLVEETGEKDGDIDGDEDTVFWDKFDAFRQKNIDKRDLKEIIDFLESVISWLNENEGPEDFDEPFIKEIRVVCGNFRNLPARDGGDGKYDSATKDLNAIWEDGARKLEEMVEKLVRHKIRISEAAQDARAIETTDGSKVAHSLNQTGSSSAPAKKGNKGQQNKKKSNNKNKDKGKGKGKGKGKK